MAETRIIKLEVDQSEALKNLEQTEAAIIDLKNEQKELNQQLKEGTVSQQEYVQSKVQLDNKIKQETENRKHLTNAINTESNSLAAQKLKLKELIAERDKIDRSTVEGSKKFDAMNKSVLELNTSIKKAEEQGGTFQRNVGNYKGVIDQFTGGAYSAAQGVAAMTKASLTFIATPIGAIIAAVALAVSSLIAYFKGSEEGQNRWNKIVTVGQTILERFKDILEDVGEFLFDAFANPKQAMIDLFNFLKENIINRFTAFKVILEGILELDVKKIGNGIIQAGTGIENATDKLADFSKSMTATVNQAIKDGAKLADMQAKLVKDERKQLEEASARKLQIAELRRKADEAEGENKLHYLNQALALEKSNAEEELMLSQQRRDIAAEEMRLNGDDIEAKDKLAKAEAALNDAKTAFFENTRKMNKERVALEKQLEEAIYKRLDADIKAGADAEIAAFKAQQASEAELAKSLENIEKKSQARDKAMELDLEAIDAETQAEIDASNLEYENYLTNEERKQKKAQETADKIVAITMGTTEVVSDIFSKVTAVRNMEADLQIQKVKLQQQEELKLLQEKLDRGEISEEEFKKAKGEIDKQAAAEEDAIKRKAFEANKVNLIAQSIIDAIQSGLAAFRALAGIPVVGPVLGAAAAAAALTFGYKQVDMIRQQQYVPGGFAEGGFTGEGGKYEPAGVVHRGEVVWSQADVAAVGGPQRANRMRPTFRGYADGGIVTSAMTNQIDSQFMNNFQMPEVYLSMKEMSDFNSQQAVKVSIVEA